MKQVLGVDGSLFAHVRSRDSGLRGGFGKIGPKGTYKILPASLVKENHPARYAGMGMLYPLNTSI